MRLRSAVFAGSWYPRVATECRKQVESFFREAPPVPRGFGEPVGGIVPHAGWVFSGAIAGKVIGLLRAGAPPETVVLFGGHLGPGSRHLIMAEGAWETPFGAMEVDRDLAQALLGEFPLQKQEPESAEPDNTMELQLPMVKYAFPQARLLPLAPAPTVESIRIGIRCAQLAREAGRTVRVLGSTDLTHYGPGYGFVPRGRGKEAERWVRDELDRRIVEQVMRMSPEGILEEALGSQNACCPGAVASGVACSKELGARTPLMVAYGTSADVLPGEDFVGYAGILFWS